ncbi:sensor histidine kinase [Chryseobacterium luquanense]|uniref:Histidine kinase n=1 Tax=Chryseobacterium luquanense TaxID=2983766 RepID=A0ABT3Y1F9_9FLAO|nr:sensor histidine kinase [Chryseobacterium luquanense]MCX8531982.1 histidine kinase [Chryseobacterium luquanense]
MKKIVPHIILIPLLLSIPIVSSPDFDGTLSVFRVSPFQREFIRFVLVIIFFYLNLNIFLPNFYSKKRFLAFTGCIVISFGLMVALPYLLTSADSFSQNPPPMEMRNPMPSGNISQPTDGKQPFPRFGPQNDGSYHQMIFSSVLPFLFSFLSSLFIFRNNEKKELERSKAKAELLNLKYQLQPHFLFNILNSIYSLALLKSDDAPNGILKLSNVMRYVVQESSKDFVDLTKEIEYIKDYIALQLVRTDSSLDFTYTEIGDLKNLKIAPFILINFIENAFKYGFNAEENSKISVKVIVQESALNFVVFNKIVNTNVNEENSLKVGLKNTFEHLNQVYPEKHTITINENDETYEVDLKISLI